MQTRRILSPAIPATAFTSTDGGRCERLENTPALRMRRFMVCWLSMALLGNSGALTAAAGIRLQHAFARDGSDGLAPQGAMLRATDGALYGTTLRGGAHGQGVLFKFSPESKDYQVIHHFSLQKSNGRSPGGPLAEGKDGALYGTTSLGGSASLGTVFKIKKDGKGFTILHSFTGVVGDGRVPFAGVRQGKDLAWLGTTDEGGQFGSGTVYRLNPDGRGYRILHHFGGKFRLDGETPRGTLCKASDGKWYGTTTAGGRDGLGTIYVMNGDASGYRLLRACVGAPQDIAQPFGGLIEATDGRLYGTSLGGGSGLQGTVFRLQKDGTGFEILRAFTGLGAEGRNPFAGVVEGKDGALFGVTLSGGSNAAGVMFQLARAGSGYKTLFEFSENGEAGRNPYAELTLAPDGSLYGTTSSGGPGRAGAIYRVRPGP